ncbi:MAG: tetratricopeptide repeat protein [Candidatus Methylomirabilales bacterium]
MAQEELKQKAMEYFQKAYELQMQGNLEGAIAYYTKSIDLYPTAEAYTFRGWTYSFLGRLDEAIEECHKAIAVDPDFGNPYNDIGAYLIQKGQFDEAIPWLEKAILAKRYESRAFPHMNLGRIWERKGQWQKAMEEYKKAVEANPDYPLALQALRRLQAMMN